MSHTESNASNAGSQSEPRIVVDEDWKSRVEAEREELRKREAAQSSAAGASGAGSTAGAKPIGRLPPASFMTLVETLAMQAMASLGEAAKPPAADQKADESARDRQLHLEMAKHLIDSLAVLETKTKGNLDEQEAKHLDGVLHELRMAYVNIQTRA